MLTHEGYVMPPPELAAAVLAPREMNVTLSNPSPDKKWFLDEIGDGPTPMTIFGKPFDELGGVFIDYKANRTRALTRRNNDRHPDHLGGRRVAEDDRDAAEHARDQRALDAGRLGRGVHDARRRRTHVWVTDLATNKPRQITKTPMLATFVTNFTLINGGKQLVAVFPPDGRTARPLPPPVPAGPEILLGMDAEKNRLRTFPSLMSTPYDFQLLEWHATGQIGIVDVATGAVTKFGTPAMITAVRHVARRQVRARDAHDQAVLVHRADEQLRIDRGDLGRDRQGAGEDERAPDQSRRAGHADADAG